MRSYIKIYGPPIYDALIELEKIAIQTPEVTMMSSILEFEPSLIFGEQSYENLLTIPSLEYRFFKTNKKIDETSGEKYIKNISKSGARLGDYDFYFEWLKKPDMRDISELLKKVDAALKPLGCQYTITSKR